MLPKSNKFRFLVIVGLFLKVCAVCGCGGDGNASSNKTVFAEITYPQSMEQIYSSLSVNASLYSDAQMNSSSKIAGPVQPANNDTPDEFEFDFPQIENGKYYFQILFKNGASVSSTASSGAIASLNAEVVFEGDGGVHVRFLESNFDFSYDDDQDGVLNFDETAGSALLTWTPRESSISMDLYGVTYGNSLFVAVGEDGIIVTSANGKDWAKQNAGTENVLYDVAYGGGVFVAVGGNDIMSSPNCFFSQTLLRTAGAFLLVVVTIYQHLQTESCGLNQTSRSGLYATT